MYVNMEPISTNQRETRRRDTWWCTAAVAFPAAGEAGSVVPGGVEEDV